MRDHAIVPTAQRLAEENNVDWRRLSGSGEGGSVVEQDVLGYLAQVMRGEETTNPTPEPLPEGLSAWPEEPERRRSTPERTPNRAPSRASDRIADRLEPQGLAKPAAEGGADRNFATPFTAPPVAVTKPISEADPTPWTVEKPAQAAPETVPEAAFKIDKPPVRPEAETATPPKADLADAYREALAELALLKERVADLEAERSQHVNELHQLSRMQETIALQKNEGAKLGALQSEVRDLKAQLAAAQRAGERVEALAAHNRDLEARLVRARTFKSKAKAEFERIMTDNMMLEHELADLKKARRGLFRKS